MTGSPVLCGTGTKQGGTGSEQGGTGCQYDMPSENIWVQKGSSNKLIGREAMHVGKWKKKKKVVLL